jgi:hypothetical protein
LRLGRDTLPLTLPTVLSRGDRESFRQAQAQIDAARATAFQQNMRTIMQAVWGQVATNNFATSAVGPAYPGELPPKPKPTVTPKRVPILGEYADLGLQIDGRLEFRDEKNPLSSSILSRTVEARSSRFLRSIFSSQPSPAASLPTESTSISTTTHSASSTLRTTSRSITRGSRVNLCKSSKSAT